MSFNKAITHGKEHRKPWIGKIKVKILTILVEIMALVNIVEVIVCINIPKKK